MIRREYGILSNKLKLLFWGSVRVVYLVIEREWMRFVNKILKIQSKYLSAKIACLRFVLSLKAYLRLYKAGFRISNSKSDVVSGFEINRFYWNDKVIQQMPDIDRVDDHYNTIHNGHTESLN
jgi:hypothetical protein